MINKFKIIINNINELTDLVNNNIKIITLIIENIDNIIIQINEILNIKDQYNSVIIKKIKNLIDVFITTFNILLKKLEDLYLPKYNLRNNPDWIEIFFNYENNQHELFNIPGHRLIYNKNLSIGKISIYGKINTEVFLIGNIYNESDTIDYSFIKISIEKIKKRFYKLKNYYECRNSELFLYYNNISLIY